jgi:hypothetical protein
VTSSARRGAARRLSEHASKHTHVALVVVTTALLAIWATRGILARTGEPSVPLDDSFIHFGYARSFATLHPLVYVPGDPPTSGATSLLWALVLAPFWAIGLRGTAIIWAAWALAWVALGGLALDLRRLAAGLVGGAPAAAAGAMVLACGGYAWSAGSGMEIVPFAWLLVRTTRLAVEWIEAATVSITMGGPESPPKPPEVRRGRLKRLRSELCAFGFLVALMRPEGALASLLAAVALAGFTPASAGARGNRGRFAALIPVAGVLCVPLVFRAFTGSFASAAAQIKWLPLSPYLRGAALRDALFEHVAAIFTLFLGGHSRYLAALPRDCEVIALLGLGAVAVAGVRRRRPWRAAGVIVLALGLAIPATYEYPDANRCRYLWPFVAAWFVGLAALADAGGDLARRLSPRLGAVRVLLAWAPVPLFAWKLPAAIDDLARCCDEIRLQQVALGRWIGEHLPEDAVVGVNDAGAIPYLSGRRTFDIVGLTSPAEARYWAAGPGSRFEHYERLGRRALPTYFAVYEGWLRAPPLLGAKLTERAVPGGSTLGGETAVVREADYALLGSGELPLGGGAGELVDALDVADLESEAEHGYELLDATKRDDLVLWIDQHADGGRAGRGLDRFELSLVPGGRLVVRLGSLDAGGAPVQVRVDGAPIAALNLEAPWQEHAIDLGPEVAAGRHVIEVATTPRRRFVSMHYWSYRPAAADAPR